MLCWHKAASALCRGAFISLILVCGLTLSAVKIEKRGLAIGDEPRTGLQGANDVVYDYGGEGPGEQMVRLEVGRGFPMSPAREHKSGSTV